MEAFVSSSDPGRSLAVVHAEQELFREINARVHEVALRLGDAAAGGAQTVDFICECSREHCIERVALTGEEYRRLRARLAPILAPGHEAL